MWRHESEKEKEKEWWYNSQVIKLNISSTWNFFPSSLSLSWYIESRREKSSEREREKWSSGERKSRTRWSLHYTFSVFHSSQNPGAVSPFLAKKKKEKVKMQVRCNFSQRREKEREEKVEKERERRKNWEGKREKKKLRRKEREEKIEKERERERV